MSESQLMKVKEFFQSDKDGYVWTVAEQINKWLEKENLVNFTIHYAVAAATEINQHGCGLPLYRSRALVVYKPRTR